MTTTINTPSAQQHRRASLTSSCLLNPPARPPRRICSVKTLSALVTSCPADFPFLLTPSASRAKCHNTYRLAPRFDAASFFLVSNCEEVSRLPRIRDLSGLDEEEVNMPPSKRLKMRSSTKPMPW